MLGVRVNPLTIRELNQEIVGAVENQAKIVIANHNLHSIYLFHRNERMRAFYESATITHIDGMPLIWVARLMGKRLRREQRVTYLEWIEPLLELAHGNRWRVFYLGSEETVVDKGIQLLRQQYPSIDFDHQHGYFDSGADSAANLGVLNQIREFGPHILMIGMGMPRQEIWVQDNLSELNSNAVLLAGGMIDYIAGKVPSPPRWLGKLGFEWLARLLAEPKRLGRRYILEPWFLLPLLIKDLCRYQTRK